jgi:hypothetical protein
VTVERALSSIEPLAVEGRRSRRRDVEDAIQPSDRHHATDEVIREDQLQPNTLLRQSTVRRDQDA